HLLVRGPGDADRDREEERDHADRLRARSRTAARQIAGGRDLRGLPDSLPPDHDDDDGGAAGIAADRARLRRRRRSAPPARPRRRRRTAGVAVDHALPDAGRLHLPGRSRRDGAGRGRGMGGTGGLGRRGRKGGMNPAYPAFPARPTFPAPPAPPAIFSMRAHSRSVTRTTGRREMRTSGKSANALSALISASVTGRESFFTGATSTTAALPLVSFGSG